MKLLNIKIFLILMVMCFSASIYAQGNTNSLWTEVSKPNAVQNSGNQFKSYPDKAIYFRLNIDSLRQIIEEAPKRGSSSARFSDVIVKFPNSKGVMESYRITEASTMTDDLQALFPETRSYSGKGIDNPSAIIRFSISLEKGLSSMVLSDKNTVFIEPYTDDLSIYVVYERTSSDIRSSSFICQTEFIEQNITNFDIEAYRNANDGMLRTFRLALACTGEYAQFHGGTLAGVVAAMNTTMTRVNGVFERDVALTMVTVNNTSIIYFNSGSDPYTNNNGGTMLGENQTVCDTNIGSSNYDIGHVFSTGGGGVAYLNSPCTGFKAGGVTGSGSPTGDTFDIDYVAHEMGHQYGGNHTQNNACNRSSVSVEPGSASTIMGYAGICAPNVQNNSDDYFHGENIKEMWANISAGNSQCAAQSNTGNTAPIATAGNDYTIPISTPFVLRGTATDADVGDSLTYCWEQTDTTPATMPPVDTSNSGPAFRTILPKTSSDRYMPDFNTVLAGATASTWEVVPSVSRTMDFSLTVRDNASGGGSSASGNMTATSTASAGPFIVTSQATPETWNSGATELITWNVAGTTANGVNTANVNILMTEDGGATFTTLLANTPNDGSQGITVPNITTSTARVIVEGAGNIFYNVNAANITIQTSDFVLNFANTTQSVCAPNDAVFNFTYNTYLGFSGTTTFTASGNPVGTAVTFNPTSATVNGTAVIVTISGITDAMVGANIITITGTSGSIVRSVDITVNVYSATFNVLTIISPTNGAIGITSPYDLTWNSDINATAYDIEIASDISFTTIVESQTVTTNTYTAVSLSTNVQYFWRVKPTNSCADGNWSTIFNFTTAGITCSTFNSSDTPINIPDNNSTGASSTIVVATPVEITDVNVTINITHTWDDDLTITLTSPSGTNVTLSNRNGGNGNNYTATIFDDAAAGNITAGNAPFTGTYQPEGSLATLNSEISTGNWVLTVVDSANQDIGSIDSWSIELCGTNDCLISTVWTGSWNNGNPSISKIAILNADYTTSAITPSFEACSLIVNGVNTLTISSGYYIKIQKDLTISNNATLEIEHEGSLVMVDDLGVVTNNGTTNVHKTTPNYAEYDYTYWSSPVQNENIGTVFAANPSNRIYYFNTANFNDNNSDSFDDEQNDWYIATGIMNPGIGLIAMGEGAFNTPINNFPYPTYTQSVVFSGPVNNGVITLNVDQDNSSTDAFINQNLLGNPYPSAIDPELFIQGNSSALEGTLYFWTHRTFISDSQPGVDTYNFTNDDYNSYNLSGMVASGAGQVTPLNFKIASGQGFFANVTDPNIDVVFNNSMRVNTGNDNFYRINPPQEKDRIWLNLTSDGNVFRQLLVAFFDNTTQGYDQKYDGRRLENGNNYNFYSLIEQDENEYVIQARETFNDNQEIYLGFETTQPGNLTISIGNMEGILADDITQVYLEDKVLNVFHDLKVSDYTFYINQQGIINDRFVLRFNTNTLSVEDVSIAEDNLIILDDHGFINIHTSKYTRITSVKVYDILGRLLIDSKHNTSIVKIESTKFNKGTVLIFQILLENNNLLIKKTIKI